MAFSIRVKIDQHEVEISGTREEVMKTLDDLSALVASVSKAFEVAKAKPTAVPTVSVSSISYPTIGPVQNCSEAVLRLLETDWGKWRPRTLPEMVAALKANAVHYSSSKMSSTLMWLVKKGKVRRWKTDAGYVYILAEKEEAKKP